jgi:hypothetical protein
MAKTKQQYLNQTEFAKLQGWSRSYVTQLKGEGRLVMTDENKVDVEASLLLINQTADPNRDDVKKRHADNRGADKPKTKSADEESFARGRAKEQHYKAQQAELDFKKAIGELVNREDMQRAVSDMVTTFRQEIENIPHRIAADLVGKEIGEIRTILKRSVHDALAALERGCEDKIKQQTQEVT